MMKKNFKNKLSFNNIWMSSENKKIKIKNKKEIIKTKI